jgi:hypothetical protein
MRSLKPAQLFVTSVLPVLQGLTKSERRTVDELITGSENVGRQHDVVPAAGDRPADHLLGLFGAVEVRGVVEVDVGFDASLPAQVTISEQFAAVVKDTKRTTSKSFQRIPD